MRVFQDAVSRIVLDHPELRGQSLRVLLYLTSVTKWDNSIPNPASTAQAMNLHRSHVSRAYGDLVAVGAIIKRMDGYYLSPLLGWKGTERQLDAFCRELFTDGRLALPAGRGVVQAHELPQS